MLNVDARYPITEPRSLAVLVYGGLMSLGGLVFGEI